MLTFTRKRFAPVLAAWCFSALIGQTASANVYPSGVKIFDDDQTITSCETVTIRYVLNENADGNAGNPGVTINIRRAGDDAIVRTVTIATQTKGVQTFTWDKTDGVNPVPDDNYYFEIITLDDGYGAWTRIDADNTFNNFELPRGVAVNKNNTPGNEYFGRVYVSNPRTNATGAGRAMGDGLYIVNPDWSETDIPGGTGPKTGGVDWTTDGSGGVGPFRLQVGPDNQLYITDWSDAHSGLWIADPEITTATEVLVGTIARNGVGLDDVKGSLPDVTIDGVGANRKLYTIDEDFIGTGGPTRTGSVWVYDIGAALTTSTPPTIFYDDEAGGDVIINFQNSIDQGGGSFWVSQIRSAGTDEPSLVEIDAAGNVVWESLASLGSPDPLRGTQGMAYGTDTAAGGTRNYIAMATNRTGGVIVIFNPDTRTVDTTFNFGSTTNCDAVFDAAGNLYVSNRSAERVRIWSPPTGVNTFTTKSGAFTLSGAGAGGPPITDQPDNQSVCLNAPASFTVAGSGGALQYQWYRNGNAIPGATNATLMVTADGNNAANGDVFTATVCNASGVRLSDPATLIIYAAPTITTDPCPEVVTTGDDASFTAAATSAVTPDTTLTYQWRKTIGNNPPVNVGTNSPNLTLTDVPASDDGALIDVVVTDSCGRSSTSGMALLTVLPLGCSDPFADADRNGIVDLNDYALFQLCYTGPGGAGFDVAVCGCFDRDNDSDIDDGEDGDSDFQAFQNCAGTHPLPADADCDGTGGGGPTPVFADDFNINTAANWNLFQIGDDFQVTFAYDYSAMGIPPAPSGSGTSGLKMEANLVEPAATAAVTLSPIGQTFTGSYTLEFDMWINANGPFPDGGAGSTEFVTAGIGYDSSLLVVNHASPITGSGGWFAVDGEGQSGGRDFRAFKNSGEQFGESGQFAAPGGSAAAPLSGNAHSIFNQYYHCAFPGGQMAPIFQQNTFPQQTGALAPGAVGLAWRHVKIRVFPSGAGTAAEWSIDGLIICTLRTNVGVTFPVSGNIAIGYMDVFSSVSDNAALSFGLIDNLKVTQD